MLQLISCLMGCATHFASARCRRGNLNVYLACVMTCGDPPMTSRVLSLPNRPGRNSPTLDGPRLGWPERDPNQEPRFVGHMSTAASFHCTLLCSSNYAQYLSKDLS